MVHLCPFFRSVGDCGRHRPRCPSGTWICGRIFSHISLKTCSSKPCLTLRFLQCVSSGGLAGGSLLATGVRVPEWGVGRAEEGRRCLWRRGSAEVGGGHLTPVSHSTPCQPWACHARVKLVPHFTSEPGAALCVTWYLSFSLGRFLQ